MDDMQIFIPITKIDAARRLVYGVVTAETPDITGEVCDYEFDQATLSKMVAKIRRRDRGQELRQFACHAFQHRCRQARRHRVQ